MTTAPPLLSARNLHKRFAESFGPVAAFAHMIGAGPGKRIARAVTDVSFDVMKGETLSIVGESGSGKSTVARMIAGLTRPSEGAVLLEGEDLHSLRSAKRKAARLRTQMIFQNPFASLNPRMRVAEIIGEAPKVHRLTTPEAHDAYIDDVMRQAGLDPADKNRYPHQFSGGQRQRIGIARALAVKPDIIICDEAVAALDVSIQAQILNLLIDLRERNGLTYIFISHDLSVVRHISDRVAVMYAGRIVEIGDVESIFNTPQHPYTKALLREAPSISRARVVAPPLAGETPSPFNMPPGCAFHARCPQAEDRCLNEQPALRKTSLSAAAACHFVPA